MTYVLQESQEKCLIETSEQFEVKTKKVTKCLREDVLLEQMPQNSCLRLRKRQFHISLEKRIAI